MTERHQHVGLCILMTLVVLVMDVPAVFGFGSIEALHKELAQAREKMRVSEAAEAKVEADLTQLVQSGHASPQTIRNYELYLQRLKALVVENRLKVSQLVTLQLKYGMGSALMPSPSSDGDQSEEPSGIPEESISDPVTDLDRQLDQSLATFDAALLKRMELIKIQSAEKIKDLEDEAEAARKRLKDQGIDIDAQGDQQTGGPSKHKDSQAGSQPAQGESGVQADAADDMKSDRKDASGTGQEASGSDPEEIGSTAEGGSSLTREEERRYGKGEDDDIVARQLREAALKETDPELREKLWKEYEAYNQNR